MRTARYLGLCSRIAAELGARVVLKHTTVKKASQKSLTACPVPVVIAGGPKVDTALEVFRVRLRWHAVWSYWC